jgi:pimeloyl-ACP methyl ester carboxylesterase
MHVILIPGLWLDGSSWDKVLPPLEKAGLVPHALTLPGMESKDADRSRITLADHVDAVVAEIDSIDTADGSLIVVGHSAGAGIASAVIDARPDRVARAVYVGGFPAADGEALVNGFTAVNGEVPLPEWSDFDDADLGDLDEAARAEFRANAIPSPEQVINGPVRLSDDRRYDVPVTVVCPEFSSEMLRGWIEADMAPVREFTKLRHLDYVDLPTGHWPQFTRPEDLARIIIDAAGGRA